jgi:opacity protein-like surface antigen
LHAGHHPKKQEWKRMKKLLVGAAVFAAILGTAPAARAQQSNAVTVGFSGGLNLTSGDLSNTNGTGFNIQAHAGYKPSSLAFGLRGDLGIWTTPGKTVTPIAGGASVSYPGITWTTLNANGVYNFEGAKDATFVPYVIGGVGIYNGTKGIGTKFGINAGGGVTFKLSGFDAFAEARFHNVFTDGFSARIIPISFGINLKP